MAREVVTLQEEERLQVVAAALQDTQHGGFPVVSGAGTFQGLITRFELMTVLCKAFSSGGLQAATVDPDIDYSEFAGMRAGRLGDPGLASQLLSRARQADPAAKLRLTKFVNRSAMCLPERFSLHRTYNIFRGLVLRHLTVVDDAFRVTGIITRKDLMGFAIEEKLLQQARPPL